MADTPNWRCLELGTIDYQEALNLQRRLVAAKQQDRLKADTLILLEHPAVFTLGRQGGRQNLKVAEAFLMAQGIAIIQAERGGDITFHGPGQLVGYPIVNLQANGWEATGLVAGLEEVMIRTLSEWGIQAGRKGLNRGVWHADQKIGSIGIAVSKGISFHGFALNVQLDLEPFEWIHPCGLSGIRVTSMQNILAHPVSITAVRQSLKQQVESVFKVKLLVESWAGTGQNEDCVQK